MDDRDKIIQELGDKLCEFCPWTNGEISHRCDSVCEGSYCDGALDGYFEANDNQENTNSK